VRVEGSYENVEVVVVVGDFGLGGDARVRILGRLELPEVLDDRGEAPDFVVVLPSITGGAATRCATAVVAFAAVGDGGDAAVCKAKTTAAIGVSGIMNCPGS